MAATTFKRNEVLVLLGAGACVEAGIPDSNSMVREIELLMDEKVNRAERYLDLYRYIKSAVCYADGLGGLFGDDVPFNIERLVNCLDQLLQREKHPLYPFVGAWNVKLARLLHKSWHVVVTQAPAFSVARAWRSSPSSLSLLFIDRIALPAGRMMRPAR